VSWCHVGFGDPMPVTMVFPFVTFGGSWTKALKLLSFAEVDATGQVLRTLRFGCSFGGDLP